jgi:pilus assembly protein CpaE
MSSRRPILLMTDERDTVEAVDAALGSDSRFMVNGTCRDMQELAAMLQRKAVPAALVDIDVAPQRMLEDLDRLGVRFPQTRFVVISRDMSGDLVLAAMQAGARHFLVKKSLTAELSGILHRIVPEEMAAAQRLGVVITVLSASGGCGTTTLAVNLANEMHLETGEPSLLIDIDVSYGAVASYLGIAGQYGIADVLASSGHVDPQLIHSTVINYSDGMAVLVSPASANFSNPAPLDFHNLDRAMEACKQAFRQTVIDAPRVTHDVAAMLAAQSAMTLIVFQLNVKDIRVARAMLLALTDRGVPKDSLLPVANRCQKHVMVSLEDAQRALGSIPMRRIRNDYPNAVRAMNYGRPLAQTAPRSGMLRDIRELAAELVKVAEGRAHGAVR